MTRIFAALALCLPVLFQGCAQSGVYDTVYDQSTKVEAGAAIGLDAPFGFTGSAWAAPHEQKAEDITLADLPGFTFGVTDPWNVLPPPFGTMYVPWKVVVTLVRTIPFVTYPKAGEGSPGTVTWVSGEHPGPIWYAIGPGIEDVDAYVLPVHETAAADHTPVPGHGRYGEYWASRANAYFRTIGHAGYTLKYLLLNANSDLPPYDSWYPDAMERGKTTIHKTFDTFLFGYDWDDPYIN
jgi:hypothetical protein